jgi:mRNA interferase MazF
MVARGELYLAELGEPVGHEQGGERPVLIVSAQPWLDARPPVVAVLPLTRTYRERTTHVEVEGGRTTGLTATSYVKGEDIRAISPDRLRHRLGRIDPMAMVRVEVILRRLLAL